MPGRSNELLHTALLDYAKAPGKYNVGLRQPPLLFACIPEILQLAVNRAHDAGPAAGVAHSAALRNAARFFTGTALLFPGAGPHEVMGLDRNFDGAELKERYRLLMRLTHPDFATASFLALPADAAVRVNLAYEALSSPELRRQHATPPASSSVKAPAIRTAHRHTHAAVRKPGKKISKPRLIQLAIACSVAATSLVVLSLIMGGHDAADLVQRARPPAVKPVVAAVKELPATAAMRMPAKALQPSTPLPVAATAPQQQTASNVITVPPPPQTYLLAPELTHALATPRTPDSVPVQVARVEPAAPAFVRPMPELQTMPAPVAVTTVAVATPPPPRPGPAPQPGPAPVAGVSLAEAQPLLSLLLQHLESGQGERVIELLDREARGKPAAKALSRQYDGLVDGMRPVRLSHVEFRGESKEGRLFVTGNIRLQPGEQTGGSPGKAMQLRAEFASRGGTVVMTGLSGVSSN